MSYNLIESRLPASLINHDQLPSFYSEGIFVPLRSSGDHNTFKYYGPEILGALPSTETNIANRHNPHPYIGNQLRRGFEPELNTYCDHRDDPEIGATGGFELDSIPAGRVAKYPKGGEYSKSSKHPKGKPQLNTYFSKMSSALLSTEVLSVLLADAEFSSRRCWVFSPARHGFWHRGRFAKYPKGGEYSKSSKHPKGKPHLNGLFSQEATALKGGFEFDSFWSRTAVNRP